MKPGNVFEDGLLAIDPGLQGTGWARWNPITLQRERLAQRPFRPTDVGVLSVPSRMKEAVWWERALWLADQLADLIASDTMQFAHVVIEMTEFQPSAAHRVMAWKTGDLQRLTFLIGAIGHAVQPHPFRAIETSGWKGQLPKEIVQLRITKLFGESACSALGLKTHAWDATGLGLFYLNQA